MREKNWTRVNTKKKGGVIIKNVFENTPAKTPRPFKRHGNNRRKPFQYILHGCALSWRKVSFESGSEKLWIRLEEFADMFNKQKNQTVK